MHEKIYIIGPCGSGKTTLANLLSNKYHISNYELDKVVWDDDKHIKREEKDISRLFHTIIRKKSWIIEDVGRDKFIEGREKADIIYYIKLFKIIAYYRVIKRWILQKIGIEKYNYPPTFQQLFYFISTVSSYYRKEKGKLKSLEKYHDKLIFIHSKDFYEL